MATNVKNALYTKQFNRLQLLRHLRMTPLSRASLARLTGLTRAAISLITEELIGEGMIRESSLAAQSRMRGRTPVLLELRGDAAYAVGVRLTRKSCHVGICDFRGKKLASQRLERAATPKELIRGITDTANRMVAELKIDREKILGVGVAAPGPVDVLSGKILNPPDFENFRNFDIGRDLSRALNLPVYLENDANAAALQNYMDGKFEGKENFLLLIVDHGVGSGVISQGKLLRSGSFSCELGHISINFRGKRCACGNRGCLEVYAATHQVLTNFPGYESWDQLMESPEADTALDMEAEYLATAILSFTNIMHIDAVLLSGDMQTQCERIAPMIHAHMHGRSLAMTENQVAILPALHDSVREACSIVFGHYLEVC